MLALTLCAMTAAPARAQTMPGSLTNAILLLDQKPIQEELKLDKEQAAKVADAFKKQLTTRQAIRDLEAEERPKKIAELDKESEKIALDILKPEQTKRFHQIALQVLGPRAFTRPQVIVALKLTDGQKVQVDEVLKEVANQVKGLRQPGGNRSAVQKKMRELAKAGQDKIVQTLSNDQKTKWKELTGETFKGEVRIGPPDRLQDKKP
jgi:hypothetical protein